MTDGENDSMRREPGEEPGSEGPAIVPRVGGVVKKTSRFSREVVATMIALASTAFGVVAALAWNAAITAWFNRSFGNEIAGQITPGAKVSALFVYAVVATLVGVIVIVLLGRLAARINAEPVEFKYPVVPKG
jgi:uncharacterized membrane protein YjjP (DUF1212 family)